jgi:N-acetylneuraminic acid mutarotase
MPSPTPTPLPPEVAALDAARESMSAAGGYAFELKGSLIIQTSEGLEVDIPVTYIGDALTDYNSARISLVAPSNIIEHDVIALQNMGTLFGETQRMSYAFDAETRRWIEREELLPLSFLTNPRILLGSDSFETSDIATEGEMRLKGKETHDGVETNVISGKLLESDIAAQMSELEVTYRIGAEDDLLKQVQVSGNFAPSIVQTFIDDTRVASIQGNLTVDFSDYGKDVAYKAPHLVSPRFSHDATLLDDGRVLVSGGWTGVANNNEIFPYPVVFSQIYDPETDTWTTTNRIEPEDYEELSFLIYSPAARLPDGRIVSVALSEESQSRNPDDVTSAIAIFDPETDEWIHLSDIPSNRIFTDIIALEDGRIIVVGGLDLKAMSSSLATIEPADLVESYNTDTGEWQTRGPMNEPAMEHSLVLLDDGRVMVVGGFNESDKMHGTDRAEIFDPGTTDWTLTGSTNVSRMFPVAITLSDGRALVTGSAVSHSPVPNNSPNSETYDHDTGEWTATGPMSVRRFGHTLTLLSDGRVLAAGGEDPMGDDYLLYSSTEIFDPDTNTWSAGPDLSQPRSSHSATLMPDGSVLLAGGISQQGERYPVASTEFITP